MISLIFNNEIIAIPRREVSTGITVPTEVYDMFGTEYGMFIPLTGSGYQLIRWIRKGMVDKLPKKSIMTYLLHVSNSGEIMVVTADTEMDSIHSIPYHSKKFSRFHGIREVTEAYNSILETCTTIAEAVRVVDEGCPEGMYDPIIFFASDWVKYAITKDYTKTFYHTTFTQ